MEPIDTLDKCPRCAVTPHPFIGEDQGANSRQTMDAADPQIVVCVECREREVFAASAKLPPIPFTAWPVRLERLIAEDRLRLAYLREKPVSELLRVRRRRERTNQPE
jgi:hypothetical protein